MSSSGHGVYGRKLTTKAGFSRFSVRSGVLKRRAAPDKTDGNMPMAKLDLDRFLAAQDGGVYRRALRELQAGAKETHWMWFIFPQMDGLGSSPTARRYALRSREEASAYLNHDILGHRLREVTQAMLSHAKGSALDILGTPDDLKFCSSMTLFAALSPPGSLFEKALQRFYGGQTDPRTLALIGSNTV